jgi:6-phosphogluconate dehydrogenase
MHFGMIGLGRMGGNMVKRLRRAKLTLACYSRTAETTQALARETGVTGCDTLEQLVSVLKTPRIVWLMLPAGTPTEETLQKIVPMLAKGDIVVDGANAYYKDSLRHAAELGAMGIRFMDAGVSGGVWGLENGYALMVGGDRETVGDVTPYLKALAPAPDKGWLHCGPAGSGHFTKMVHNGIEYGMMQAYAEGFALLKGKSDFNLDLSAIAELWRHGSVVRSWLLDLTAEFLAKDQSLTKIQPVVADSGEGRWTALESIEQGVPAPVMTLALMSRFDSQGKADFGNRMLSMMRKGFGGHAVKGQT